MSDRPESLCVDYDVAQKQWEFERAHGPTHRIHNKVIGGFLRNRLRGARVLDVGCGDGFHSHLLQDSNTVVSSDLSATAIAMTTARRGAASPALRSSVTTLPFRDQSFDAVISLEVFEHIENDRAAVEECFRVLKPDGRLLFSVPGDPRLYSSIDRRDGHYRRYTKDVLVGRLFAGFQVTELRAFGFPLMWTYYWLLGRLMSVDNPPAVTRTRFARVLMSLLYGIFHFDLMFRGTTMPLTLYGSARRFQDRDPGAKVVRA